MKNKEAEAGSRVEVKIKGKIYEGTLLESYEKDVLLLKLESGYNIGLKRKEIGSVKVLSRGKIAEKSSNSKSSIQKMQLHKNLPGISMIITGGTISSQLDYKTGGVKPLTQPEQLFSIAPKLLQTVNIRKLERPFQLLSENMTPREWQKLAGLAAKLLNEKENQGIIITHGTDTLHFTAAALSFMLRDLNKPVCFTYSQRSIDRGSSDATLNLQCAGYASISNIAECMLVGHATSSDNFCYAIRGTKVRKMHTSRRDTFRAINDAPLAKISADGKLEILNKNYKKRDDNRQVNEDTAFEEKVALIKYYPGANPEILDILTDKKYKGVVIEGTGLGHVATSESRLNWLPSIKRAVQQGIAIAIAPQTIFGRLQPQVYSSGRELAAAGVIHTEDMLPEVAYIKLGWILGHTQNAKEVRHLMLTNIAGEINRNLSEKDFLY